MSGFCGGGEKVIFARKKGKPKKLDRLSTTSETHPAPFKIGWEGIRPEKGERKGQ